MTGCSMPSLMDAQTAERLAPRPEDRRFLEGLWQRYEPFAERDFGQKFRTQTQQHFWEMYLTVALLRQQKSVVIQQSPKSGRCGPDVKVNDGEKVIWIEAIAVQHGSGIRAVPRREVPDDGSVVVGYVPDDAMTLRYTAALKEKFEKFEVYANKRVIGSEDVCVIGLNAGELDYRYTELDYPRVLQALFPIGKYAVSINPETMQTIHEGYQTREQIGSVPTTFFTTSKHSMISALLFSYSDIYNPPAVNGNDFVIVHNPFATNPLPRSWLKLGREYWVENERIQPPAIWSKEAAHLE